MYFDKQFRIGQDPITHSNAITILINALRGCRYAVRAEGGRKSPTAAAFVRGKPLLAQIAFEFIRRQWRGVQETLCLLAILVAQERRLRFGLDAFGNHNKIEIACHGDQ